MHKTSLSAHTLYHPFIPDQLRVRRGPVPLRHLAQHVQREALGSPYRRAQQQASQHACNRVTMPAGVATTLGTGGSGNRGRMG